VPPKPDGPYPRELRRPPYDVVRGSFPSVDLHLADVPTGSLSRAQVELQSNASGLLSAAAVACVIATAALAAVTAGEPSSDSAASTLLGLSGGVVAVIVRPDPHRIVTRLLRGVRALAGVTAICSFVAALLLTLETQPQVVFFVLSGFSVVSTVGVVAAWSRAAVSGGRVEESPWEHHWDEDEQRRAQRGPDHVPALLNAELPYATAVQLLGFHRPAVRIASSEGSRAKYQWTLDFDAEVRRRLDEGLGLNGPRCFLMKVRGGSRRSSRRRSRRGRRPRWRRPRRASPPG
jgi:hypothetical protein